MLNAVSNKKQPDNLHCSICKDRTLIWEWLLEWFCGHWSSSRMLRISLSYSSRQTLDSQSFPIIILLGFIRC